MTFVAVVSRNCALCCINCICVVFLFSYINFSEIIHMLVRCGTLSHAVKHVSLLAKRPHLEMRRFCKTIFYWWTCYHYLQKGRISGCDCFAKRTICCRVCYLAYRKAVYWRCGHFAKHYPVCIVTVTSYKSAIWWMISFS